MIIKGEVMTAEQAIGQFGLLCLFGCQCVVTDARRGLVFGTIADPVDCVIDEPDGALLYVEFEADDDWHLAHVYPETQIVLFGMGA